MSGKLDRENRSSTLAVAWVGRRPVGRHAESILRRSRFHVAGDRDAGVTPPTPGEASSPASSWTKVVGPFDNCIRTTGRTFWMEVNGSGGSPASRRAKRKPVSRAQSENATHRRWLVERRTSTQNVSDDATTTVSSVSRTSGENGGGCGAPTGAIVIRLRVNSASQFSRPAYGALPSVRQ